MDRVLYGLVRALFGVVARLPSGLAYPLCEAAAGLVHALDHKHRRIGLVNLRIAFPDRSEDWRRNVLRESYRRIGDHFVEVSRLTRCSREDIRRHVRYDEGLGLEHYLEARKTGRGVLFLTAHISAWELLPSAHSVLGHPLKFVVRPLDNLYLDRWVTDLRSRFGNQVLSKFGSIRDLLRAIRSGEDVGLLIDQNVQEKDGVYAPFFGKPAATTAAAAMLALKTGAVVVMGFMVPDDVRGHYRIRFYPPLKTENTGNREADLVRNTTVYNAHIERVIREFPSCWLWGHRRFRTQPDGSSPYSA